MNKQKTMHIGRIVVAACFILLSSVAVVKTAEPPIPDIYDDFSDGTWENRTGIDPWGRQLPEWNFESPYLGTREKLSASNGYLLYESGGKEVRISVPSQIVYGTWEWKYRFPEGRTVYSSHDAKYFFAYIIMDGSRTNCYARGLVSDGHTWFVKPGEHPDNHLLYPETGGWGIGLFVDTRWHVCRVTRDPEKGFTIYHDNKIISSGYNPGDPKDNGKNGLFTEVKDDTLTTSSEFCMTMQSASSPGSIDVDDIKIYDEVLPAPTDIPLRSLYAMGEGENPSSLTPLVNYANKDMGAEASGSPDDANPGQEAEQMINGITTDYDGGKGYGYTIWPDYLMVQLKETQAIEEIYLSLWDFKDCQLTRSFPNPRKYDFEVDVSEDGNNWTRVATREKAMQIQKIILEGREIKYVRMRGKHYKEYQPGKFPDPPDIIDVVDEFYVVEIEAYGPGNESDITPPEITLNNITVNGIVDDATVTSVDINGTSVSVTAGAYSQEVDVSATNTITITATNGDNKTVTRTIEIK